MRTMKVNGWLATAAVLFVLAIPTPGSAGTIVYDVTNLGGSAWEYSYTLQGFNLLQYQGIAIFFDLNRYSNLQDPPPDYPPDFYTFVLQPDLNLPADGEYDALALVDNPVIPNSFTVQFDWMGAGTPGSQPYQLYQSDDQGLVLGILGQGQTVPPGGVIPEPGSLLLLGAGLVGIYAVIRRKR